MNESEPAARTASGKKRKPFSRVLRHLLFSFGILVPLAILLRAMLPVAVERGAAYLSRYYLGLPARIGNADFGLLRGLLVLEDVSLGAMPDAVSPRDAAVKPPPIDASNALVHFDRIVLRWSWQGLLRKKVRLEEMVLEEPTLRVLREEDGAIDPLRHSAPAMKSAPGNPAASPGAKAREIWPIEIANFVLRSPGIYLIDAPSKENLLEFSLETFELSDVAMKGADLSFGQVSVRGPVLKVWRELVFGTAPAEVSPGARQTDVRPRPTETGVGSRSGIRIGAINVERARFAWMSKVGPLDVLLTLKSSGITAEEGKHFPLEATAQIGSGQVSIKGDTGILPPYFHGRVTWKELSFPPLLLAGLPEYAPWLHSGVASGDLRLTAAFGGPEGAPFLKFSGSASVENFSAVEPAENKLSVGWRSMDISAREIYLPLPEEGKPSRPISADIESINLVAPTVRYTRPWAPLEELILLSMGASPGETGAAPKTAPSPDWLRLSIGRADVSGGEIEVRDTVFSANSTVKEVAGTVRDFQFPENIFGALSLSANLPTASRLSLEGSLGAGFVGQFSISLQELDLPAVSPYAKAAGVSLDTGRVTLQTKLETGGTAIKADNDIVFHKLGLSMQNPDSFAKEFGIPINLALILLRDAAGNIRLKIPVQIDEKGTAVSYGHVVGSAVRAAILGALSSPLKMVGVGFGEKTPGSPDGGIPPTSIAPIKFRPGSAEPESSAGTRIDGLAKMFAGRPDVGLVLRGRSGEEDRPELAKEILVGRILSREGLPEVPDAGFLAKRRIAQYLAKLGKAEAAVLDPKDADLYDRFIAAVQVPPERFTALSNARAEKIRGLLLAKGLSAKRVSIGPPEKAGPPGVLISFKDLPTGAQKTEN